MKKFLIAIALALASTGHAQTPLSHFVQVAWTDPNNPTGTTYNVYRANGACSSTSTFTIVNTAPITGLTFQDNSVTVGTFCYQVTAVVNSLESGPSPTAGVPVRPFSPVTLTVKGQQ